MSLPNQGAEWTAEERAKVAALKAEGFSFKAIAKEIKRTPGAVYALTRRLGMYNDYDKRQRVDIFEPISHREERIEEHEEQETRVNCDGFLKLLAKHHPHRAGELVATDKGIRVVGGTAEKPRFAEASVLTDLPESGPIIPPATLVPTSSCALTWC